MNKKIAICLIVFILTIMFGSKVFADRPAYSQTIHVFKGWYLLGEGSDFNTTLMPPATSVFAYLPILNRYFPIKPRPTETEKSQIQKDFKDRGIDIDKTEGRIVGTYWYYYPSEQDITFKVDYGQTHRLFAGWNLKFITPEMVGKNFDDVTGDCIVKKAFAYNSEGSERWVNLKGYTFESVKGLKQIGLGFAINVEKECKFGEKGGSLPPPLPVFN